jgi:predicted phage-related endonuclease
MIEIEEAQGSEAWLAHRAKCLNASEAPAMMGVNHHRSRSDLLKEKSTGIAPEIDAETQARFDRGLKEEEMARPIAERIIGEELFQIVATDDTGKYSASADGSTMFCEIGFEHKSWNDSLAATVATGYVPESHKWQLVHQQMVFGFDKILFMVSNGTEEKMVYCWFRATDEEIKRLRAGWDQFEADLEDYQYVEAKPDAIGRAPDQLPSLHIEVTGMVTDSNLDEFKVTALAVFRGIKTDLQTDQDFADAEKAIKFCKDAEERLESAKSHALSQTESIEELFRTIDAIKEEARTVRIKLDKLVKVEKDNRKYEIVTKAMAEYREHIDGLNKRIGGKFMPAIVPAFAESIKGLKSLNSMIDRITTTLANAKIDANETAMLIAYNKSAVGDDMALFPDWLNVCTKSEEDFAAMLSMRINQRKEAEEKRLAERSAVKDAMTEAIPRDIQTASVETPTNAIQHGIDLIQKQNQWTVIDPQGRMHKGTLEQMTLLLLQQRPLENTIKQED